MGQEGWQREQKMMGTTTRNNRRWDDMRTTMGNNKWWGWQWATMGSMKGTTWTMRKTMGVERTMKAIRVIVKVIQGFPFTTKPSNGVHYVTIEPITVIQTSFKIYPSFVKDICQPWIGCELKQWPSKQKWNECYPLLTPPISFLFIFVCNFVSMDQEQSLYWQYCLLHLYNCNACTFGTNYCLFLSIWFFNFSLGKEILEVNNTKRDENQTQCLVEPKHQMAKH